MADIISSVPLRPKWADRQHIAAADLTAEQLWQDAQLMRLRRLALGWGVVAGLEVSAKGEGVVIAPGYGITAAGSEVYLPDSFHWSDILKRIVKTCGGSDSPCSDPAERKTEKRPGVGAWLVLVPRPVESCPRPTVPEGCVHPGSAFAYSRQGIGFQPELRCQLPEHLLRRLPDCKQINAFLEDVPVPMPDDQDDILPLACITYDGNKQLVIRMEQRRKLLPLSLLQDLMTCCDCSREAIKPDPEPEPQPKPDPGSAWENPELSRVGKLIEQIEGALPGGVKDLELSFAEVFAEDTASGVFRRNVKSDSEIKRSFAASLLVHDQESLEHYLAGDHLALFKAMGSENLLYRRDTSMRERLEKLTLADLWQQGKHGYASVQSQYAGVTGKELASLDPASIKHRFEKVSFADVAALDWLHGRIIGLLEQR